METLFTLIYYFLLITFLAMVTIGCCLMWYILIRLLFNAIDSVCKNIKGDKSL